MAKNDRANFGSKLGVILASAGSAVGLGNIWRFPYETGNHGGAAFILIYLGCILLLGLPIMIAEFLIGRRSRANTARAYQKLVPGTHWRWVGRMGVLAGFLILSYYAVVAGWTLEYIFEAATNGFAGKTSGEFISSFQQFCERGRKRNRKVLQDHDAYPVYHYPHTGCLLGHSAGSRCRYRIPAQARL